MEKKSISPIVTNGDTLAVSVEEHERSAEINAQVMMALSVLDGHYKENVAAYADALHACSQQIDEARAELVHLEHESAPKRSLLEEREKEVEHAVRMLDYLSEQWIQKAMVTSELESELEHISYAPSEGDAMLARRRAEMAKDQEEIERLELTLLQHELEKQNLLLVIEPIDRKIAAVKKRIADLEAQKRYMESAHLHRITHIGTQSQLPDKKT